MDLFVDEKKLTLPLGATGIDLAKELNQTMPHQALALKKEDTLYDLSLPLSEGDRVHLLSFEEPEGKAVFWHSSAHILAQAVLRIWPSALPTIGPAIAQGFYYDFGNLSLSESDFPLIEKEIKNILQENLSPEKETFASKEEALKAFASNPYKCELIQSFEETLTGYRQGEFFDLCRGPHLPSLNKVKAFKILKTSGAYWKGDPSKPMLTRIYAISFPEKSLLTDYLNMLEEAKKRDHKILGAKLDLFSHQEVAPGMTFIHPAGMRVWNALLDYWHEEHRAAGYIEIKTPVMVSQALWKQSGHWQNYRQNMYTSTIDEQTYAIKPMNCPGCMLYYKSRMHSYREFPLRIAEIGHVHRHEASGAISGLFRVRSFHQDDAHIFLTPPQIEKEILAILHLVDRIYTTFGLTYHLELSTRPEKETIGTDEQWEFATQALQSALDKHNKPYKISKGEGAFYGPKIDLHILDCLNRSWQCGTIQLDMALPERFELEYVTSHATRERPVMLHRALFGSIERFFGILIEHFAGKFPLWMSPRQIRIIPVADRHIPLAKQFRQRCQELGFYAEVDESDESVSKKIRLAQLDQVNYMITLGDRELEQNTLSIRTRLGEKQEDLSWDTFFSLLLQEKNSRALSSCFSNAPVAKCK